jgi:hypothetical protein
MYFIFFTAKHITKPSNGFATYYTSARLLLDGENPKNFYNDDYFSNEVEKHIPGIYEIYLVNLPTTTFLIFPLGGFDYQTARVLWILFNLILFLIALGLLIKLLKFDNIWLPIVLILVFMFQPLYENIILAQAYIFIFCMLTFILISYMSQKYWMPGVLVGLILIIKSAGIFLVLLFLLKKKWQIISFTILTLVTLFIISLPVLGLDSWGAYVIKVVDHSSNSSLSATAYQSVHSFFHHLFVFDMRWNPFPIWNLPVVAKALTIIFTLIIILISIRLVTKHTDPTLSFAIFITIGLFLSPLSIDYHYILILIPFFIVLSKLRENSSAFHWSVFIISYLLIAVKLPYTSNKITEGYWALFAYPKLFGAISLWLLTMDMLRNGSQQKVKYNSRNY